MTREQAAMLRTIIGEAATDASDPSYQERCSLAIKIIDGEMELNEELSNLALMKCAEPGKPPKVPVYPYHCGHNDKVMESIQELLLIQAKVNKL